MCLRNRTINIDLWYFFYTKLFDIFRKLTKLLLIFHCFLKMWTLRTLAHTLVLLIVFLHLSLFLYLWNKEERKYIYTKQTSFGMRVCEHFLKKKNNVFKISSCCSISSSLFKKMHFTNGILPLREGGGQNVTISISLFCLRDP